MVTSHHKNLRQTSRRPQGLKKGKPKSAAGVSEILFFGCSCTLRLYLRMQTLLQMESQNGIQRIAWKNHRRFPVNQQCREPGVVDKRTEKLLFFEK